MKKLKDIKGITLVALVVTIILLLILAGITISQLTESGLFENAKIARERYENAQSEEDIEIDKIANELDSYISGDRNFLIKNYSTREQDTGLKWLDGKTIYQLTYATQTPSTTDDADVAILPDDIDKIIYFGGFIQTVAGNLPIVSYASSEYNVYTQTRLNKGTITTRMSYSGWCNLPEYITIQYTKKD